jgi:FAD/FMN-containing dehydrogenase
MALSPDVKLELVKIVGQNDCKDDDFVLTAYSQTMIYQPPTKPDVVVLPETKEEVSAILRLANENKITVVPRAGGTAGPISIADGGIIIDMAKMDKFVNIEERTLTCTVQAGVTVYNCVKELRKRGYDVPLKGWYGPGVTMGSWICGPSMVGSRAARYGTADKWSLGLEVVLPTGEIVQTGSGAFENCHPFMSNPWLSLNSMDRLFHQSLGTLGIVTEVSFLMVPLPEATDHIAFGFDDVESLSNAASSVQIAGAATDIEHEDCDIYKLLLMPVDYPLVLCVTNQGYKEEVERKTEVARRLCEKAGGHALPAKYAELTWNNTANFNFRTASFGLFACAAACTSYESYPEIYRIIKDTWKKYGLMNGWSAWTCFPNWVQGWTIGYYDPNTQMEAFQKAMFEITKKCISVPDSYPYTLKPPFEDLLQKIKDCLDPNGIMNPGAWFMISGAQARLLEAIPLPDEQ